MGGGLGVRVHGTDLAPHAVDPASVAPLPCERVFEVAAASFSVGQRLPLHLQLAPDRLFLEAHHAHRLHGREREKKKTAVEEVRGER